MLKYVFALILPVLLMPGSARGQIAASSADVAGRIIAAAQADSFAYGRLAELVDTFGPRLSGSQNLENAIDWILAQMAADGLHNVRGEKVMVPHWVRGAESAELLEPRRKAMKILGLGRSVGTPRRGIKAPVLVVGSFEELQARAGGAKGKIILYNVPFTSYGETVRYRSRGAIEAAKLGALAVLVRSVTPHSLSTPHTGAMSRYDENVPKIPAAAVTVEDAMMLQRMQDRGVQPVVRLKMGAKTLPDALSRNVVAELLGSELPAEVVVMGGHIDSWDVGQGAMDDAGGCVAAWEALRLLQQLGLRPRRTIRVVLWTNEENGLAGGTAYRDSHLAELDDHILAIESDGGVFKPSGFGFTGSDEARAMIEDIASLLAPIEAGTILPRGGGADIGPIMRLGVPGMSLNVDRTKYFWYHHSDSDTIDKLDPHELNLCVATLAVMAYVVADMPKRLPRVPVEGD